jgi:hypothetical protein
MLWQKLLIDKCSILHFVNFLGNFAQVMKVKKNNLREKAAPIV